MGDVAVYVEMSAVLDRPDATALLAKVAEQKWDDPLWRLRNLYFIIDKQGEKIRFVPNQEQEKLLANLWHQNVILKSRQLGMSTLIELLEFDQALFNRDHTGSIIADTLPNAGRLFAKIELAYKELPPKLKERLPLKAQASKTSFEFAHGSSVTVSVSTRGGTVQFLHVSELGPIATKFPQRAQEIITGAFESVPLTGLKVVESTADGASGPFYDLVMTAHKRQQEGRPETALDWRLHFFPWFTSKDNRLSDADTAQVVIPDELQKYFRELDSKHGIKTDANQRAWYTKKKETLKRKIKQEHPSTVEEAFEVAIEGGIYAEEMATVREKGRITTVPLDPMVPVNTFWDLGTRHVTFIWLHQRIGLQHRFFKCFSAAGKGLGKWWHELEEYRLKERFLWGRHYLPHDADMKMLGEDIETKRQILERAGMKDSVVVPRVLQISDGIESTRAVLDVDCWFDREGCHEGIRALDAYQYQWDEVHGVWSRQPLDNWAADGADAYRQFAQGWVEHGAGGAGLQAHKARMRRAF